MLSTQLPVRSERPFIIQQLTPVRHNEQWWLQDSEQQMMQIKNEHNTIWKLLSMSGGEAMDMVVIGRENHYEPVGAWHNNEYKILI